MNNILSELEFEDYIIERLVQGNGYIERDHTYYDDKFAADRELLMRFLSETQPETMAQLKKVFKDKLEDTLIATINAEATKERGSLLSVLKHGIELANFKLDLLYQKPATTFNKDAAIRYQKNIFSVMKEVWASDKERVDLVVFINGLAVIAIELKCNLAGQSYADAITQYRTERNPKTRLFRQYTEGCVFCRAGLTGAGFLTKTGDNAGRLHVPQGKGLCLTGMRTTQKKPGKSGKRSFREERFSMIIMAAEKSRATKEESAHGRTLFRTAFRALIYRETA